MSSTKCHCNSDLDEYGKCERCRRYPEACLCKKIQKNGDFVDRTESGDYVVRAEGDFVADKVGRGDFVSRKW